VRAGRGVQCERKRGITEQTSAQLRASEPETRLEHRFRPKLATDS
jgi:hypothetical protein